MLLAGQFERWMPPSLVPLNFLGGEELPKVCSMCVCLTQPKLHTILLPQYTSAMAAIENQLNIKGDAAVQLFKWWTPPSVVPLNCQGGEELPKICSMCIRLIQLEIHTILLLQYTSAIADRDNQLNINRDAAGWLFERWTPQSLEPLNFLGGEELPKICSMCVRLTQLELHTILLLQYTSAIAAIENQLNIQWRCCWPAVGTMNTSKLGTVELPGWRGAAKNLFHVCSSYTARDTHHFASPVY